jgi:hypothetical protein
MLSQPRLFPQAAVEDRFRPEKQPKSVNCFPILLIFATYLSSFHPKFLEDELGLHPLPLGIQKSLKSLHHYPGILHSLVQEDMKKWLNQG